MPFTRPVSLINPLALRLLNAVTTICSADGGGQALQHYEPFSYPLDGLLEWNRMYGPRGFYQYQSVVPPHARLDATRAMLHEIARSCEGSFLAVRKTFGQRSARGMLSSPRPGTSLALDFPNRDERTLRLFDRLDAIVLEADGALYPAKDSRMPPHVFEAGYPRLHEFLPMRDAGMSPPCRDGFSGVALETIRLAACADTFTTKAHRRRGCDFGHCRTLRAFVGMA